MRKFLLALGGLVLVLLIAYLVRGTVHLTYEDKNMGVRFRYPAVLKLNSISRESSRTVFFSERTLPDFKISGGSTNMIAMHRFLEKSFQEELTRALGNIPLNQKVEDITFKGLSAKLLTGNLNPIGTRLNSKHILVEKDGTIYNFGVEWYSDVNIEKQFDQMMDSLIFLN